MKKSIYLELQLLNAKQRVFVAVLFLLSCMLSCLIVAPM
jgi:hypothetical protein